MKQIIINALHSKLESTLINAEFVCVDKGRHYVRNVNNVFHGVSIVLEQGTSVSDKGYRVKVFVDVWTPHLSEEKKELSSYPRDYCPLLGGRVSNIRINGNGLLDIENDSEEELSKLDIINSQVESMALPWFRLFYNLEATERTMRILNEQYQINHVDDCELKKLSSQFPPIDIDSFSFYTPFEKGLDKVYLQQEINPIIDENLNKIGFEQYESNDKTVWVNEIAKDTKCSISYELLDSVFLRIWVHIANPVMFPKGYWEQLSSQYMVPPLIGTPVGDSSLCLVGSLNLKCFIKDNLYPVIQSLESATGRKNFVSSVVPNGLLGVKLEELLEKDF